jgi:hypothetical protein
MAEKTQQAAKNTEAKRENSASRTRRIDYSQSMSSPIDQVLYLQRTIGNQAVQRLIKSGALQAKFKIGQPGDKYEQEAEWVADAVMRMPEPGVQRQVEEEEEPLQAKPLAEQITPLVQREVEPAVEPRLSPKKEEDAVKSNKKFAEKLGWNEKFDHFKILVPSSTVKLLRALWVSKEYREFAQLVARFQFYILGFKGQDIDGVIGYRTWDRVRPIGEVVAKQKVVKWEASKKICYEASRERLTKGYKRATGKKLVPKEKRETFKIILKSKPSELKAAGIEKKYWGTSAAGALVSLGKGEFVSESDIWNNNALKPGAVIQVWKKKSDLDRIRKEKKPLSWGTSAVFLEYVKKDSVKVFHISGDETWKRGEFQVWIGANLLAR